MAGYLIDEDRIRKKERKNKKKMDLFAQSGVSEYIVYIYTIIVIEYIQGRREKKKKERPLSANCKAERLTLAVSGSSFVQCRFS